MMKQGRAGPGVSQGRIVVQGAGTGPGPATLKRAQGPAAQGPGPTEGRGPAPSSRGMDPGRGGPPHGPSGCPAAQKFEPCCEAVLAHRRASTGGRHCERECAQGGVPSHGLPGRREPLADWAAIAAAAELGWQVSGLSGEARGRFPGSPSTLAFKLLCSSARSRVARPRHRHQAQQLCTSRRWCSTASSHTRSAPSCQTSTRSSTQSRG